MMIARKTVAAFCLLALLTAQSLVAQEESKQRQGTEIQPATKTNEAKTCDCLEGQCKCENGDCETEIALPSIGNSAAVASTTKQKSEQLTSTHEQTKVFEPKVNGKAAKFASFRVLSDGGLAICVSSGSQGFVQVYSADMDLANQFELDFLPTAIDVDSDNKIYVAGSSNLKVLSTTGQVIAETNSIGQVGDRESMFKKARAKLEAQQKRMTTQYQNAIESQKELIAKYEDKDDKRSKRMLDRAKKSLERYESIVKENQFEITDELIENFLSNGSSVTAVSATANDIFISTRSAAGSGYEIYRMNHALTDSEKIMEGLRGCCGQMDIHARDDKVYIAENCKHQVGVYDRDGESLAAFGEKLHQDNQGFGGCCNPMNVFCCPNGEVLTAESGVGKIKRFDADGNLIGFVGAAKLVAGCKHVAFGYDQERDRYFVQSAGDNTICVLTPKTSDTSTSTEESEETDGSKDATDMAKAKRLRRSR